MPKVTPKKPKVKKLTVAELRVIQAKEMLERFRKLAAPKKLTTIPSKLDILLRKHKVIAVDIETPMLCPYQERYPIVLVIHVGGQTFWWDLRKEVPMFLAKYFASRDWTKIIHSSIFDCSWLKWHYGWDFCNIFDTQVTEEVLLGIGEPPEHINQNEEWYKEKFSTKLNYTLARYKLAKISKELQTSFVGMVDEPLSKEQIKYFRDDVKFLEPLMLKQLKEGKKLDLLRCIELENNLTEVCYRMRHKGIGFDKKLWMELHEANTKVLTRLLAQLNKMTHNAVENWNSPDQIKRYFAGKGILINSLTDLVDQDKVSVAKPFRNKSKALDLLVKIRTEAFKYVNTYGENWLTTTWGKGATAMELPTIGPDGRVHANIRQIISTGRMSMSQPNLQQLPNNIEGNPNHVHRKAFIPTKGYRFASMDFKGQELGIMAAGANALAWIKAIHEGKDVHSMEASVYFPVEWAKGKTKDCKYPFKCKCPKHSEVREKGKKTNFGMPYGKTPPGLAEDFGISLWEAKNIVGAWHRDHPELSAWLKTNAATAIETFSIRTFPRINRRRSLVLEHEEWRRRNQGMNTPVQGTGADILKLALWYVYKFLEENPTWFKRVNLILSVHDQIMSEVKIGFEEKWNKILSDISERAAAEILEIEGLVTAEIDIMDFWEPKA
jgi:DNA polymerase I-like protein with 3'-5' exonuclease and polymerase domains